MLQLEKMVKEEFLSNNKKIKEEDLNEYLNSLKKEELIRLALLQVFIDEEYINFMKVNGAKNKPKKYIIDYITNNLDKILASYIKIIRYQEIEQLKLVIKNNGKQVIFNDVPISIHFISLLKTFSLAKVEYHIKDDSLKFFMPKEFMDVFNNCLKNKKLLELNELNNKTYNYAVTVIDTYGIVTLDKLHELFESQMFKIAKNDLQHIIAAMAIYEGVNIYEYNDEVLLCSLEFYDEDYALNFYHKQKMHYKRYSKEDYQNIADFKYVETLKSYKKFINYLCRNYKNISKNIEYINEFIIYDYLISAQTSQEVADYNFRSHIIKNFDADNNQVEELLKLMRNIFKDYPKWLKRGNV